MNTISVAKNLLVGKTCNTCVFYSKREFEICWNIRNSNDMLASADGYSEEVPVEYTCKNWVKKY